MASITLANRIQQQQQQQQQQVSYTVTVSVSVRGQSCAKVCDLMLDVSPRRQFAACFMT